MLTITYVLLYNNFPSFETVNNNIKKYFASHRSFKLQKKIINTKEPVSYVYFCLGCNMKFVNIEDLTMYNTKIGTY